MNSNISSIHSGLKARFFAFIMDLIIVLFPVVIFIILILFIAQPSKSGSFLIVIIIPATMLYIYFFISDLKNASLGKRYMALVTLDKYKMNLSPAKAALRSLMKILFGWITWMTIPGSEKKLAIYDIILKTSVFYVNEKNVLKNDSNEKRINFLKKAQVILPVITFLLFLIFIFLKIKFNSILMGKENAVDYLIYLLIPITFFNTLFALTISIQIKFQKLTSDIIANLNITINTILFFIFTFFLIKTIALM